MYARVTPDIICVPYMYESDIYMVGVSESDSHLYESDIYMIGVSESDSHLYMDMMHTRQDLGNSKAILT